jgi:hypothetical protein
LPEDSCVERTRREEREHKGASRVSVTESGHKWDSATESLTRSMKVEKERRKGA